MDSEIYKMIYIDKINEELEYELGLYIIDFEIHKEIKSDNIRILGHYFIKNNKNKSKLIINNKKYNLKEFININEFKEDKIKIKIILNKDLSNISHMFENCAKLEELSINDEIINFYDGFDEGWEYSSDNSDNSDNSNDNSYYDNFYNKQKFDFVSSDS